jgi:hypothetical protein
MTFIVVIEKSTKPKFIEIIGNISNCSNGLLKLNILNIQINYPTNR